MGSSLRSRGGVFISYRREETAGQAGCLYEHLADRFGEDRVFKDTHSIAPGVDFANRIVEDLSVCNVLLALIGRDWSAITDSKGARRLDDPHDFVRVEIEIALKRDIPVNQYWLMEPRCLKPVICPRVCGLFLDAKRVNSAIPASNPT